MPKKYSCSYSLFPQLYKNGYLTLQNTLMKQQMPAKPASQTVDKVPHFCAGFFYDKSRKLSIIAAFKGLL